MAQAIVAEIAGELMGNDQSCRPDRSPGQHGGFARIAHLLAQTDLAFGFQSGFKAIASFSNSMMTVEPSRKRAPRPDRERSSYRRSSSVRSGLSVRIDDAVQTVSMLPTMVAPTSTITNRPCVGERRRTTARCAQTIRARPGQ